MTTKKVLLVDDERKFVDALAKRLMLRGFYPTVCYDGNSALERMGKGVYPHMILDLRLPDIDGLEVLRRVQRDHPETRVIILTAHGTDHDEQVCSESGAFAFLHKPVKVSNLARLMSDKGGKA